MIVKTRLKNFGQVAQEAAEELFDPSEAYWPFSPMLPTPIEESESHQVPWITYAPEWRKPTKVAGIVGDYLPKFRTGTSLRKESKESILKSLKLIPSAHIYGSNLPALYKETRDIPQPPLYFVDGVPSYGEVGFGQTSDTSVAPYAGTGWWGQLESTLTKLSESYFSLKEAKYQAEIKAAQAAMMPKVTLPTIIPAGYEKYVPYALAGGGLLLLLMLRRKPSRRRLRRNPGSSKVTTIRRLKRKLGEARTPMEEHRIVKKIERLRFGQKKLPWAR
jgi:hypothetical protein